MSETNDLKRMRTDQEKLMTETVYVQRLSKTSDGAGGYTETWSTVATTKGRIAPSTQSGSEELIGGKISPTAEYVITLPWNADVRHSDQLQITGIQYDVVKVEERTRKTALRVLCNRV